MKHMDVVGNSGCHVGLEYFAGKVCVRKGTENPVYAPRLKAQIRLQKDFREHFSGSRDIYVPEVYFEHDGVSAYSCFMEYVPYGDFVEFMQVSGRSSLESLMIKISRFIEDNLAASSDESVGHVVFAKLEELEINIPLEYRSNLVMDRINRAKKYIDKNGLSLPLGRTHGDLTLSNVLISSSAKRICLIDFLDGYVRSPFMDLVKLRQDTQFQWSLRKVRKVYDPVRVGQALAWSDSYIRNRFGFAERVYALLQTVNLMRILPYSRSAEEVEFLRSCIQKLEF